MIFGVGLSVGLVIYALGQNMNVYFTPSQLAAVQTWPRHVIRIGGMVKQGSIQRTPDSLTVHFILTDYQHDIAIMYTGILPALFREGQGVVAQGKLIDPNRFMAEQILAKHDEKYMPPGIKK